MPASSCLIGAAGVVVLLVVEVDLEALKSQKRSERTQTKKMRLCKY